MDNNLREASAEGVTPSQYAPYGRGVKAYRGVVDNLLRDGSGDSGEDLPGLGHRPQWQGN